MLILSRDLWSLLTLYKKCYRLLALLGSVVEGARLSFFEHDDCIEFGNDLVIDLMSGASEDHGLSVSVVS